MNSLLVNHLIGFSLLVTTGFPLAAFIYTRNRRSEVHWSFAGFILAMAWWSLFTIFMITAKDPAWALFWDKLCLTGVAFIPTLFLNFSIAFVGKGDRLRGLLRWSYIASILFLVLLWATSWFVKGVTPKFGLNYFTVAGPLYPAFIVSFLVNSYGGIWLMWQGFRSEPVSTHRRQVRYLFWASLFTFTGGSLNYLLVYDIRTSVADTGNYVLFAFVLSIVWMIQRYQLLDLKIVITRAGVLLTTYLVVLGGPVALCVWGQPWLQQVLGRSWWAVPVGLSTVLATVGPFVYARLRRQTEQFLLKQLEQREREATTDGLTGLLLRRAFLPRAQAALARAQADDQPCAVLMIDLDHFKETNDAHGHPVGDAVLQEAAQRLQQGLRADDLIARYGGEEFVLFLPRTAKAQALAIAERLRISVEAAPILTNAVRLTQTLSIGVAVFPEDGRTLDGLTVRADAALYTAKRAGRNRVAAT